MAGNVVKLNKDVAPFPGSPYPLYDNDGFLIGYENPRGGKIAFLPASDWITGITAFAGGGQASAVPLDYKNSQISTVASAADSVVLPFGQEGMRLTVFNAAAANALAIFPASGQAINALANDASISLAANKFMDFVFSGGKWYSNLTA